MKHELMSYNMQIKVSYPSIAKTIFFTDKRIKSVKSLKFYKSKYKKKLYKICQKLFKNKYELISLI